jgi:hypothetical protein
MISRTNKAIIVFAVLFCICVFAGNNGCNGTDSREKVDDVVEEFSGKKDVDRYQRVKGEIYQIQKRQSKKYDQLLVGDSAE